EGFYYKPRVDKELLERYREGLLAIVPAWGSEFANALKAGHDDDARAIIERYRGWYGDDGVYLEITHHPEIEGQNEVTEKIRGFAKTHGVPLVATNDVHYLSPEEQPARRTLLSIQSGSEYRTRSAEGGGEAELSFKSPDEMGVLFVDTPEALENTLKIAELCDLDIPLGAWLFPDFQIPEGSTHEQELRSLVLQKAEEKGMSGDFDVQERMQFELHTIISKGYAPYFLVVGDLLRYAREHGIFTNTRGSVGGSLVSYLLGITTVDPLVYRLPFERFLNPLRPSPPDIDLDIADNRRDEMIAYARQKYGADKVAQIGTFGTMMARGSVRDTARAMGYDLSLADEIAKMIPFGSQGFPMSIDRGMEEEPELKKRYQEDEDVRRIIDMAKKVEGCARHISVHAAGVVLSPIPLEEIVPVQWDPKGEGKPITQYDMHAVEDVGLLKFDFLGLKNLAVLADAVKRVKKIYDID
ncbi:MAG TPA: DNA polymerase III subunit alpha, partial [Candidatus Paceibacterota bacterium]|nr:DNA polymerase III subunit alpha [Candidatus Paceibacterota bacterium]